MKKRIRALKAIDSYYRIEKKWSIEIYVIMDLGRGDSGIMVRKRWELYLN